MVPGSNGCGGGGGEGKAEEGQQAQGQGQVLALVLAALRKSVVLPCQMADADDPAGAAWGMEIGWPTDVRHVAHVTFDRLHGFLGLPVEFELEIPGQVPSARSVGGLGTQLCSCLVRPAEARMFDLKLPRLPTFPFLNSCSASVFGVSPESMQCGYDDKGNSVPKILLLMQERLYAQDGLKVGVFRLFSGSAFSIVVWELQKVSGRSRTEYFFLNYFCNFSQRGSSGSPRRTARRSMSGSSSTAASCLTTSTCIVWLV